MKYAVIDIETTGLSRYKHSINYIGVGLAKDIDQPLAKKYIYNMYEDKDLDKFKSMVEKLRERKVKIIWQNGKFDTLFIHHHYGILLPIHHDIMVMGTAYEMSASHALDDMAERYLGIPSWDIPLKEKTKPNNPVVEKYLEKDLEYPWELFRFFQENMEPEHRKIYQELLMKAYKMYRKTEMNGIYFDRDKHKQVKKAYKLKQEETLKVLTDQADINWNSPQQVSNTLFEVMGLPTLKRSEKTGKPSADAKVLRRLQAKGYDIAKELLEYKFYYGANTKFLNTWDQYAKYDGRIHPSFGITNVVTGRTSCKDPNLQQVPRNKELRTLFTAPEGRSLIEADYSQIELRIAADYAVEPTMIQIYKEGGDIHTQTAMSLTGLSAEQVIGEPRSKAKAVNFGFIYGMSAKGFLGYAFDSYNAVFTRQEAERWRELFFVKYSRLLQWHKEMELLCEAQGGVYNSFGQFRSLPDIYSQDNYERSAAIRRAINTPVQSTASVLLMMAAYEIDKKLSKEMDLKVVGTIHDAVLVDVPDKYAQEAAKQIQKIMSHPEVLDIFEVEFRVPIEADVGIGAWGSK